MRWLEQMFSASSHLIVLISFLCNAGQCLRNLLHKKYSSSTQAKRAQRKVNETKFDEDVDNACTCCSCRKDVDNMMDQLNYVDISKRVQQLTVNAKSDLDFQRAFNQANSELLETFKKRPPKPDNNNTKQSPT